MPKSLQATLSHQFPQLVRQFVLCTNYGSRRSHSSRRIYDNTAQSSYQLVEALKRMAHAICHSLLWHRTDGDGIKPLRFSSFWGRSVPFQPSSSRFDDCCRTGDDQDDARAATYLSSNGRTQMGHFNGSLCFYRRLVRYLRSCARHRPVSSSRCVCSWVSTKTGDADRGGDGDPAYHRRGQHTLRWRGQTQAVTARSCCSELNNRCDNQRFLMERTSFYYVTNNMGRLR